MHLGNELGCRVDTRIGGIEALLVREEKQQVCPDKCGDKRREVVVVTHANLFGGDGVILVDHGDNAPLEQHAKGVPRVQEAAAVLHIGAREKNLAGADGVDIKEAVPQQHEARLAHCREQLFALDCCGQRRELERGTAHCHGARRADDDIVTCAEEFRALADKFHHVRLIQLLAAPGEDACAKLDDDAFLCGHSQDRGGKRATKPQYAETMVKTGKGMKAEISRCCISQETCIT